MKIKVTTEDIMEELSTNGPMMCGLTIYTDFMNYGSGTYVQTTDSFEGRHAMKLIGWFFDGNGDLVWIFQNQWATSWGESGFINIKSGQIGADALCWACDVDV